MSLKCLSATLLLIADKNPHALLGAARLGPPLDRARRRMAEQACRGTVTWGHMVRHFRPGHNPYRTARYSGRVASDAPLNGRATMLGLTGSGHNYCSSIDLHANRRRSDEAN